MKVCAKPEPGIETNGRVEARRDRLREHRLAGAGRAEEQQAALALAAGLLERLARLPERDDPAHLLLRLGLAADVVELRRPSPRRPARSDWICEMPISISGPKKIRKLKRKKSEDERWIRASGEAC